MPMASMRQPDDEPTWLLWRELAIQQVSASMCVFCACAVACWMSRRPGMGRSISIWKRHFAAGGLGQLAEAALTADRFVQF